MHFDFVNQIKENKIFFFKEDNLSKLIKKMLSYERKDRIGYVEIYEHLFLKN